MKEQNRAHDVKRLKSNEVKRGQNVMIQVSLMIRITATEVWGHILRQLKVKNDSTAGLAPGTILIKDIDQECVCAFLVSLLN